MAAKADNKTTPARALTWAEVGNKWDAQKYGSTEAWTENLDIEAIANLTSSESSERPLRHGLQY